MTDRQKAWFVGPGAGTALGAIGGSLEVLVKYFDFLGYAGTSGSGLLALCAASGMSPSQITDLCNKFLKRKDLLDPGLPIIDDGPCLFRGRVVENILREVFGNTRMGDLKYPARVTTVDMWNERACVVDSVEHPDVLVWRAGGATMRIQLAWDPIRLRDDNARGYGDGGLVLNVPHGIYDDKPEMTVGLRFVHQQDTFDLKELMDNARSDAQSPDFKPIRTKSDMLGAVANVALSTASITWPSRKQNFKEIVIGNAGNGMKFGLSDDEIAKRRKVGVESTKKALQSLEK